MKLIRIVSRELKNNTYFVVEKISALIDPSTNTQEILRIVKKYNPRYIILTHTHFDHVYNLEKIKLACGAKVLAHISENFEVDEFIEEGDRIKLGNLSLKVLHTPGHTPGSICLYEGKSKSLFSGDTVFSDGGFGRTDLTGGSLEKMVKSLEKLSEVDIEMLYPGHGDPKKVQKNHFKCFEDGKKFLLKN